MTKAEQQELRVAILARRNAGLDESKARARKDAQSKKIVELMQKHGIENVEYADVKVRALLRQDTEMVFDLARILTEVPVDKLVSTGTVTKVTDKGFSKLIREIPTIADARTVVNKDDKTLVVEAYDPSPAPAK